MAGMPRFHNNRLPQGNDWFDWLPRKVQCLLLLLLSVPATGLLFWGGLHCIQTGTPVLVGNATVDAGEFFIGSLVAFLLSMGFVGVLAGWLKPATPHISETHHPRQK